MRSIIRGRWCRAAFLTSVSLLLFACWRLEDIKDLVVSYTSPQLNGCMAGVVTAQPGGGGRLGNLLMEYWSAAALARRHHLGLALPAQILGPLSAIFQELSAQPLERVLRRPPCAALNLTERQLLEDPRHWLLSWEGLEQTLRRLSRLQLPLVLEKYMLLPEYIATSQEFLRRQFQFRPEIQRVANEKLQKIKLKTANATGASPTQVCAVGVHVRRTDYIQFMRVFYDLQREVGVSYYEAAAAAMLADLRHECAAVAFAVTSDDDQWCQHNLLPTLTRNGSKESPLSVGFLLSSDSPADDLCLLSSCQHLIMTYGSFGLSAAILSGGRTIMYDSVRHDAKKPTLPEEMVAMVPGWRVIA